MKQIIENRIKSIINHSPINVKSREGGIIIIMIIIIVGSLSHSLCLNFEIQLSLWNQFLIDSQVDRVETMGITWG